MPKAMFSEPHFNDEAAAYAKLEAIRWPDGPVCPRCGGTKAYNVSRKPGLYRCANKECRHDFTATIGTVMESSHIPLTTWFKALHLLTASKKGVSAHQLHRMLGITYKSAWFLAHRIREAMCDYESAPIGGSGKTVEADETYFGWDELGPRKGKRGKKPGPAGKRAVVALVERGGTVQSFHVERADLKTVRKIVHAQAKAGSHLRTDESALYKAAGNAFASHETVTHSVGEYVRGDVHTNTIEGYFSIFKRGMIGVYQHCGERHLHRYLSEFDFRYNTRTKLGFIDQDRLLAAIKGIEGKRLSYRWPFGTGSANHPG